MQPFDIVSVRRNPAYLEQITVTVEGQVLYSGKYTISNKKERLSDLIKRSGGLLSDAFVEGGVLIRQNKLLTANAKNKDYTKIQLLGSIDSTSRLNKDSLLQSVNNQSVGIRLEEALKNPGSQNDVYVEDGDIISIPRKLQTVSTWGGVYLPKQVLFTEDKSLRSYINESGGFLKQALQSKVFVIYANGEIKRTHQFLFFRSYPSVKTGAEIYVPLKTMKRTSSLAELSGVAAVLTSLVTVFWILKNL